MQILIDEKVKKYALQKGVKAITVDYLKTNNCCGSPFFPMVTAGPPKEKKNFDLYNVDGIEVYTYKLLDIKDGTLRLVLSNFIFFKSIEVEGVRISG